MNNRTVKHLNINRDPDNCSQIVRVGAPDTPLGLVHLSVVGMILMIVTLGIYRFWFVTKLRRYFWSRTRIDGYPLEFTGQPIELVAGLFVAILILLPFYLVLFIASLGLEHGVLIANIGAIFGLWMLSQFAVFRARRYRLTRTLWRGLRFHQSGSGIKYALLSFGWLLVTILTLGWLWPARRQVLYSYKLRNTYYGDRRGAFTASTVPLYQSGWLLLLLLSMGIIFSAWYLWKTLGAMPDGIAISSFFSLEYWDPTLPSYKLGLPLGSLLKWLLVSVALLLLPFAIAGPRYFSAEIRHFATHTAFGEVRLRSSLDKNALYSIWARFFGYFSIFSFVVIGIGILFFNAFLNSKLPAGVVENSSMRILFFAAIFLFYALVIVGYAVIHLRFLRYGQWHVISNSLSVYNAGAISEIQAGNWRMLKQRDSFGEGVADALDAGGF